MQPGFDTVPRLSTGFVALDEASGAVHCSWAPHAIWVIEDGGAGPMLYAIRQDICDDNTPPSIAAGAIFLVASLLKMRITKVQVHTATKISEVTISKCYKKLNLYKDKLFPKAAIEKYNITFDKAEPKQ